jgi:hypothetical protein
MNQFNSELDDEDFVRIQVAVLVKVTPEQVTQALQEALDDDGDLADYEILGARTLWDGTVAVVAEVKVESGMAAMEWQRDLSEGSLEAPLTLPLVDALPLQKAPGDRSEFHQT